MGQYGGKQDYSYQAFSYSDKAAPGGESAGHMGMMGYGYGAAPGMYPAGGSYDYASQPQGQHRANPSDGATGGPMKRKSIVY